MSVFIHSKKNTIVDASIHYQTGKDPDTVSKYAVGATDTLIQC